MLYPLVALAILSVLVLTYVSVHWKPDPKPATIQLFLFTPDLSIGASQMQINATINSTKTFAVIAKGTQGENLNVPMDFTVSNPAVASAAFDQTAMQVTLTFTGVGQADLTETATGTSISNVHQITVTDVVASVDLAEVVAADVESTPVQSTPVEGVAEGAGTQVTSTDAEPDPIQK